ncbi:uncharacterized protein MELLADRAFT_60021 [Melampsora larici-populina 98AG31]|uniref:RGS domain-containing protein n=1 Tax=Melampsora larici-populina (strain 98AG31 / pathotype 3-4-7) TaxID=747676 RepID=F4R9P2_MELLP|nr:uncharacterized protein MELLADRAFT_60021 [Melampsora larici-populina 98AG31]EGG11014.1 hypothetical protein MELLADRAFT_60021 [Melampsora larici-populina 98AG31]
MFFKNSPSIFPEDRKLQPKRETLKFSSLLSLPNRIIKPPVVPKASSSADAPKKEKRKFEFGKVRTWSRCSMTEVKLNDILFGLHTPPLTLGEFEDYLLHVEHTPENLYFYFWLRDYTTRYHQWGAGRSKPDVNNSMRLTLAEKREAYNQLSQQEASSEIAKNGLPVELNESLEMAISTFLYGQPAKRHRSPSSIELELNLPADVKDRIKLESTLSGHPSIFDLVEKEVMNMLEESMKRWLVLSSGNADRLRVWFAIALGTMCVIIAITGALLLNYLTSSPRLRLVTTPLFWLGIITLTCGLHRTCPVIFLFGSYRQIHAWEAVRQPEDSPLPASSGTHINLHNAITLPNATHAKPQNWPRKNQSYQPPPATTDPKNLLTAWDSVLSDDPNILKPALLSSQPSTPTLDNPLLSRLNKFFIPSKDLKATPIFGPVTRVFSPLVMRAQRRYVFTAVAWATLFTTVWIPFWLLIPSPFQRHD